MANITVRTGKGKKQKPRLKLQKHNSITLVCRYSQEGKEAVIISTDSIEMMIARLKSISASSLRKILGK